MIRTVIVDERTHVRDRCRAMLGPEFEVLSELAHQASLVERGWDPPPDLIILGDSVPIEGLEERLHRIHHALPDTDVVLLRVDPQGELSLWSATEPRPIARAGRRFSPAARVALNLLAAALGMGILAAGALFVRAASAAGAAQSEIVVAVAVGTLIPLVLFLTATLRGDRRIAVAVLAFAVAVSVNVSLGGLVVPAAAVTDNTNVFTFKRTTGFASPNLDMVQNYTPVGSGTTCPTSAGASWTCRFSSDQFSDGQQLESGFAQADLYLENDIASIAFKAADDGGQINSLSCPQSVPAGTVPGDLMVATIAVTDGGGGFTITAPSGWNLIRRTDNGTAIAMATYWKAYQSGDPSLFSWTFSAQTRCVGGIAAYKGVSNATPVDVEDGQATASGTTHATPSVTTGAANEMVVTMHAINAVATWTAPAGMNERYDLSTNGSGQAVISLILSDAVQAAASATGARTATATASDVGLAHIVALRPSSTCDATVTLKHVHAPKHRSSSSATLNDGVTLTIDRPASVAQNDVMVAAIAATVAIQTPAGWTFVDSALGSGIRMSTYRRLAGASEAATYSWTLTSAGYAAGAISAYSNVDTTSPIDAQETQATASGTSHATPTITTTQSDDMLVASFTILANDTWTPPAGMTERVDLVTTTTFVALSQNDALATAHGTTGPLSATASPSAGVGVTSLIALRPKVTAVGSGQTPSLASPFGPSLVSQSFATTAETFAAGDRLQFELLAHGNCGARLHYDGAAEVSKLTTAASVAEGLLGVLLLAPALPWVIRRWKGQRS